MLGMWGVTDSESRTTAKLCVRLRFPPCQIVCRLYKIPSDETINKLVHVSKKISDTWCLTSTKTIQLIRDGYVKISHTNTCTNKSVHLQNVRVGNTGKE